MKTTTTKNKIISTLTKRFLATMILGIGLITGAKAQMLCQAAFTYTVGSAGQVSFTNTSTGTTGSTGFYWYFGDNMMAYTQNASHVYAYNGVYTVNLQIDSATGGCNSIASQTISITNGLTCNLNPATTYTAGTNGNYSFTDASTGVDPNMIYSWFWRSQNYQYQGNAGNQTSANFTFPYNGTYYVEMTVGDSTQQCYKTATTTVVVTNSQPCQVSFTYTTGAAGMVSFTNTSVGNISYYWSFGDGTSSTATNVVHTYAYNGFYHVYLYADTTGGYCGGYAMDSILISNTATSPTCSASFTYTYNANGQVDFTNTSTGNIVNPTYSWSFGDAQSSTLFSPSNTYVYNGSYNVTLYVMDSLGNSLCSYNQVVYITNAAGGGSCNDSAYFYAYPDSSTTGVWNVYLATPFNSSYPVNATWSWGDGTSSTGLYPSHTYASAGWYTICVMAYFACGDSSYFCQTDSLYRSSSSMVTVHVLNSATAIKNNASDVNSVKVFPNPFADNLTIDLNSANNSTVNYSISDMYGNVILKEKVSVDKGGNKIALNTSGLSQGMYFVNVTDSNSKKMHTIKIVK